MSRLKNRTLGADGLLVRQLVEHTDGTEMLRAGVGFAGVMQLHLRDQ
jgi:hypothetical protein